VQAEDITAQVNNLTLDPGEPGNDLIWASSPRIRCPWRKIVDQPIDDQPARTSAGTDCTRSGGACGVGPDTMRRGGPGCGHAVGAHDARVSVNAGGARGGKAAPSDVVAVPVTATGAVAGWFVP
jgi:hypothetical protein